MKKVAFIVSLVLVLILLAVVFAATEVEQITSNEVTIGNQVWMTKNLNVDKFRNGDLILEAKTAEEWKTAGEKGEPAWCFYENDPANGEKYGKLYNWYAVNDPRGLAPEGWHIPSDAEWMETINQLGGEEKAGEFLKAMSDWFDNGNGTNESGFTALPSGVRSNHGNFSAIEKNGLWWSSTQTEKRNKEVVWYYYLDYYFDWVIREVSIKENGLSVRCVKD